MLAHLRRAHSLGQFLRFVDNRPLAATMLVADARRMGDLELVRAFYYQDDRRTESACLALEEAGNAKVGPFGSFDREARVSHRRAHRTLMARWRRSDRPASTSTRTKTACLRQRCVFAPPRLLCGPSRKLTAACFIVAQMMDDYAKLLHFQKKLDDEHPATSAAAAAAGAGPASMAVVGASVHETLRQCILRGQPKKADELKKDLKVSDERYVPLSRVF